MRDLNFELTVILTMSCLLRATEEEEPEEDVDMGGLFGGDDEDY